MLSVVTMLCYSNCITHNINEIPPALLRIFLAHMIKHIYYKAVLYLHRSSNQHNTW